MPRIAFVSVGCKLNRYEIQLMSEALAPYGFITVPFSKQADCYVINTCSVTSDADLSSRQLIRRARRQNPNGKVIATGCYAQLRPDEMKELELDAVISNREKEGLPAIVLGLFNISDGAANKTDGLMISGMDGMTRAFVKIEDGCDEECAFCTIWMARGPVRSRKTDTIIEEVNKLSANGFKEVALTGVHIGKYSSGSVDFLGLLRELLNNTSIARIRLSSLNPREITNRLISLLATEPRICPHIHLSLQSGDDDILRMMGRKYSRSEIISVTSQLAEAIPDITIGADIIVGFPGESIEAFENTRRLIDECELNHLHVFPYSDRPGTKSSNMAGKISAGEKDRRTAILRDMGRLKKAKHLEKFIGKNLQVLFENRELRNKMTGLTGNYLRVDAPLERQYLGEIVEIKPVEVSGEKLITKFNTEISPSKKD
jgi:threonylcarbamoyladenosine tRNA methylthiotransferase MtaB